jgi:SDR family mycofactocin-dependent oxidoreductase
VGKLEGQVALVTGAARGQGRQHALRLAQEGADIIAVDICAQIDTVPYALATPADLAETVRMVESCGRRILPYEVDVRDRPGLRAAVGDAVEELGRLDVVIANAGVASYASVLDMPDDMWDDMIAVNLTGVWNTLSASLPSIVAGGRGGSIVLTSSTAALRQRANTVHYAAAKAALLSMIKSVGLEMAPNFIRVNAVVLGAVRTPMIVNDQLKSIFIPGKTDVTDAEMEQALAATHPMPVGWAEPDDVSDAVVFLASDDSRYVTGTAIAVDAGTLLR